MALPAASTFSPSRGTNVFIPGYDGSARARLIVAYGLNTKDFPFNNYTTIQTMTKPIGFYRKVLASDFVRVPYKDGRQGFWADGQPSGALTQRKQGPRSTNIQYEMLRTIEEGNVGWQTQENSEFDELKLLQNMLASIAMTKRAIMIQQQALNAANYDASHVAQAANVGGGFWSMGTIGQPFIKQSLDNIRDVILKDSIGRVKINDLRLVLTPTLASAMSRSGEIRAYMAQQANAIRVIKGEDPDAKEDWSLPNPLYGFEICIESSVVVSTLPTDNATTADDGVKSYVMDTNKALVVARPGSLVSEVGGENFSTIHMLVKKGHDFKVFTEDMGEREQYTYTRVEDYFTVVVPAPETGFIVTNCTS